MSLLFAKVSDIKCQDTLHIVTFQTEHTTLAMMSLELDKNITIGTQVKLALKPTQIALATTPLNSVSLLNQLPATVVSRKDGKLLSSIMLDFEGNLLEVITTRRAAQHLNLQTEDKVTALVSESEISISEILND